MAWSYQREEQGGFSTRIPEGRIRIRVKSAEKAQSKSGNDMLVLQFEVSGYPDVIYHYISFLEDKPEITNRMLTQFFDAFKDIEDGNFNMQSWVGKVGAACIKHEEYNGNTNAKISYFVSADKQGELPAWREPEHSGNGGGQPEGGFMDVPDGADEIPF